MADQHLVAIVEPGLVLINDHIGQSVGIRREAQRLGDGRVYLADGRTADPAGAVPPQDVIGAVDARDGIPLATTYQHNPNHRLLTGDCVFMLPLELEAVLRGAVRQRYGLPPDPPPDRLTEVRDGGA